jgi:hypothetical protein
VAIRSEQQASNWSGRPPPDFLHHQHLKTLADIHRYPLPKTMTTIMLEYQLSMMAILIQVNRFPRCEANIYPQIGWLVDFEGAHLRMKDAIKL